ncbi:hypothetical protein ACIRPR_33415 [Streptomyces griseoflavus]|uniref:hypothetical protein n=1 Tax=Streptomyces griseoflavus TaxID=35619 RepID=UPI0038178E09
MSEREAAAIRAAAEHLRPRNLTTAIADVASTPLTDIDETRRWLTEIARHVHKGAPCCQGGADRCAYARHAIRMARRILAAARERGRPAGPTLGP